MNILTPIREVIVVEGTHDRDRVLHAVQADVIVTGGSRIEKQVFDQISRVAHTRGIIILTDPDYAGEQIRRRIVARFKTAKHAYIPRYEAIKDHDIGVENASVEAILHALEHVRTMWEPKEPAFSFADLLDAGLTIGAHAAVYRERVGAILGIGYGNAKAFLARLNALQVTPDEFSAAVKQARKKVDR